VGLGVVGILLQRLLKEVVRALAIVQIQFENAAQVQILCPGIDGTAAGQPSLLQRRHIDADLFGYGLCHFTLPCQNAIQIPHIGMSPNRADRRSLRLARD
jgi:hypothetical protein